MTSMLLTLSALCAASRCGVGVMWILACRAQRATGPPRSDAASAFLAAVPRRDLLLRRVLRSGLLDHLAHERAVAGHERRQRLEALAVPLLELHHAGPFVVEAAG